MTLPTPLLRCLIGLLAALPLPAAARALVTIDGSSTVYPITEAVAEEFLRARERRTWVTVGISGTGGGFRKFCRGEIDIVDASRPITEAEQAECRANGVDYLPIPVALDALTVVVGIDNPLREIDIAELRRIWAPEAQGQLTNWRQLGADYPQRELKLYGPGPDSGSFEYFTAAVMGRARASRGDYTASEDDNLLVTGVATDKGALGYFGLAYYLENQARVRAVAVRAGPGQEAVLPTLDNVRQGRYRPLSRELFIYANRASTARDEVRDFISFYLERAAELVEEVRYVPLSEARYRAGRARFLAETASGRRPESAR